MSRSFPIFAFSLGREFKLSVAEIASVCGFHSIIAVSPQLALVRFGSREDAIAAFAKLGGSIRLFEIQSECVSGEFATKSTEYFKKTMSPEGKHAFALATVGADLPLTELSLRVKKFLRDDFSVRACNVTDKTINAAAFKKSKLSKTLLETAYLEVDRKGYFGVTLACQDVDAFAGRDMNKGRDMEVGMLPPKLARMMVNLVSGRGSAESSDNAKHTFAAKRVYDPFCGLGTVLIEAFDLGFRDLLGTDISDKMAESTAKALEPLCDPIEALYRTFPMDAKKIASNPEYVRGAAIVTEGFLGEIQSAKTISAASVAEQKKLLYPIYEGFFQGLRQLDYKGTVVMCVPFWEVDRKYVFFEEFFEVLKKYGFYSDSLLPKEFSVQATKFGSLLYKRPGQTVGREIVRVVPGRVIQKDRNSEGRGLYEDRGYGKSERGERSENAEKPVWHEGRPSSDRGGRPDYSKPAPGGRPSGDRKPADGKSKGSPSAKPPGFVKPGFAGGRDSGGFGGRSSFGGGRTGGRPDSGTSRTGRGAGRGR